VPPLLRLIEIETAYADRQVVLSGVSLEVAEGEIVALVGANGAGKTTLLRSAAGMLSGQPRRGDVQLAGRSVRGWRPERIARRGVVLVGADRGLFRGLSVAENTALALWGRHGPSAAQDLALAHELFPILRERAAQRAETLSGGEQQMLALARALLRRPLLLLLDEPTLGLAPQVARAVFGTLAALRRRGIGILLAEQDARLAFEVADRAAVLEGGRIVLVGAAGDLSRHPDVRKAYLGLGDAGAAASS
jgi:branched-chain amino acid transport system ATP-binding protein